MQNITASILFRCPECHDSFEFDTVGEYEFVPCPICGANCVTVKKGGKLTLKSFRESQENAEEQIILA